MEDRTTDIKEYKAPQITDHGDLAELTAGQQGRTYNDATLPAGFPQSDNQFFSTNVV
jgi:hypothetical protein